MAGTFEQFWENVQQFQVAVFEESQTDWNWAQAFLADFRVNVLDNAPVWSLLISFRNY